MKLLHVLVLLTLFWGCQQLSFHTRYIHDMALKGLSGANINQTTYKCYDIVIGACEVFCQYELNYVPNAKYKNLAKYNYTTNECTPALDCSGFKNVSLDRKSYRCINAFYGFEVPGKEWQPVDKANRYSGYTLKNFDCNGNGYIVTTSFGWEHCKCNVGFSSTYRYHMDRVMECDKPNFIQYLLPMGNQLYYNLTDDIPWPRATAHTLYYISALWFVVRRLKFQIANFFFPYQAGLAMFVIPVQDPLLMESDYPYIVWTGIILGFLGIITAVQRTRQYMMEQEV